jgi:hypothetical protein
MPRVAGSPVQALEPFLANDRSWPQSALRENSQDIAWLMFSAWPARPAEKTSRKSVGVTALADSYEWKDEGGQAGGAF